MKLFPIISSLIILVVHSMLQWSEWNGPGWQDISMHSLRERDWDPSLMWTPCPILPPTLVPTLPYHHPHMTPHHYFCHPYSLLLLSLAYPYCFSPYPLTSVHKSILLHTTTPNLTLTLVTSFHHPYLALTLYIHNPTDPNLYIPTYL